MKRPSFQFYPADWKNNSKLRRCSEAARGAWIDVLCVLHDFDEYGVCRWPLVELARAAGVPIKLMKELVSKDVLKGADKDAAPYIHIPMHAGKKGAPVVLVEAQDGPLWYCSRFVRDEWLRQRRGAGTRFGAEQPQPQRRHAEEGTERARLREKVLAKTGGFCFHCKEHLSGAWEIDHFIQRTKGGSNLFANLVPSCVPCNQDKSDTMPDDWNAPTGVPDQPPTGSPTGRVGGRHGDGPTSTSSSTTKTNTPQTPQGGLTVVPPPEGKVKTRGIALKTFLADCEAQGVRPMRDYEPLWKYTETAKLPREYVILAWAEFCRRFGAGGVKERNVQKNWRQTFRNYVENNYLKLWAIGPDGEYFLTTQGKQAQTVAEAA